MGWKLIVGFDQWSTKNSKNKTGFESVLYLKVPRTMKMNGDLNQFDHLKYHSGYKKYFNQLDRLKYQEQWKPSGAETNWSLKEARRMKIKVCFASICSVNVPRAVEIRWGFNQFIYKSIKNRHNEMTFEFIYH